MDPMIDALSERITLIHFLLGQCRTGLAPAALAQKRDQIGRICREFEEEVSRYRADRPTDGPLLHHLAILVRQMACRAGDLDCPTSDDEMLRQAQQAILSALRPNTKDPSKISISRISTK